MCIYLYLFLFICIYLYLFLFICYTQLSKIAIENNIHLEDEPKTLFFFELITILSFFFSHLFLSKTEITGFENWKEYEDEAKSKKDYSQKHS